MKKTLIALLLVNLFAAGAAHSAVIVDTGPGPATAGFRLDGGPSWLAAEFSLGAATTITDVQGWIGGFQPLTQIGVDGTATAVIYTDGGEVPGTQLFAAAFNGDVAFDFDGPSGLNWLLAPGTYWVAYEVRFGQTLESTMPSPSQSPLGNEAVAFFTPYFECDLCDIGVRILGNPVTTGAVPEPTSLMLLSLGIAALGWSRRKKS